MARYKLLFKKSVAEDLRGIPGNDLRRILRRIEELARDPRGPGCKKLTGRDYYRVRQGQYRILYEVIDEQVVVLVVKVGQRATVYRK